MRVAVLAVLGSLLAAPAALAQPLTLQRIFASPDLSGPSPRALKLSPDGRLATLLRNRADDKDRFDLWAIDTATGATRMLVDSAKLGSGAALSEAEKMRRERAHVAGKTGIVDYAWAPDGTALLMPIDGDIYLADLKGAVRRLTDTPASELAPKISRDGRFVSFVRDQNLFVVDVASGRETQVTRDGGGTLSWGLAEFVAQEELDRLDGVWWAPQGRRLAVQRTDEAGVAVVERAAIGADGTRIVAQRYPRPGSPNAEVQLWLMASDGSARVRADLGADPDFYLARVDWAKDGRTLYVQRLSRDQKRLDMLAVDPATGASRLLFGETAATWIDLAEKDAIPLADGSLIWVSARDGHEHAWRWKVGRWTQLTRGPWDVANLIGVDAKRRRLLFLGHKDGVDAQVYAAPIDHAGVPVRLTEPGFDHDAETDDAGRRLIVTRSSQAQPPQVYLADAAGRRSAWVIENRIDDAHPLAPYRDAIVQPEFGTLKAEDGQMLHWQMRKPPGFDPAKRYPVYFYVYGGPHGGFVLDRWDARYTLYFDWLASQGWIVFSIDNRGTGARGTAFDAPIYHAMGGAEVRDQLAALAWLKAQPYVDPARVALQGKSYGGYMTLKLLEAAPHAFAAGVAVAPVARWALYDTAYTERYLGDPTKAPEVYAEADALGRVDAIADPLMLIHGMADDNVVFENSTALIARLQAAKRPFELMVYPGMTHSIVGEAVSTHLYETLNAFLDRTVRGAEPARTGQAAAGD